MSLTRGLNDARIRAADEFYTSASCVETELRQHAKHNAGHFAGRTVCCPCDGSESEFYRWFKRNYDALGLRHLVATKYNGGTKPGTMTEFDGKMETVVAMSDDGSFDSPASLAVMASCGIIATNPPFSLWRRFFSAIINMKHMPDCCILGTLPAANYACVRPHIASGRVRVGYDTKPMEFLVPPGCSGNEPVRRRDPASGLDVVQLRNTRWFTTLPVKRGPLKLTASYCADPGAYPHYDNYDAIEVGTCADIPHDYAGRMGVPLTFVERHDPAQFDIVGFSRDLPRAEFAGTSRDLFVAGKSKFSRIIIRKI